MFRLRIREKEPIGIVFNKDSKFQLYNREALKGKWWRVIPVDAKEVIALQMLIHREEKFAPAFGSGALVSDEALNKFKLSPALKKGIAKQFDL
jgi:hypothetical protein